jgi:hypothetical protein
VSNLRLICEQFYIILGRVSEFSSFVLGFNNLRRKQYILFVDSKEMFKPQKNLDETNKRMAYLKNENKTKNLA